MRGHVVGFHFCPILLSGVALFFVAFSSSLHTDLSRDKVFERVEGNTWMCYTSVITPWNVFRRFIHFWSPFILCWPQQIPLSDGMWMCQVPWAKSRIGWQILAVTINFIYIYTYIHIHLPTQWMWMCQLPWAKTPIGWHRFWSFHNKLHIIPSPLPPPPPPRRLCNILTIPHIGGKSPYFPPYTLLTTIDPLKKNIRLP